MTPDLFADDAPLAGARTPLGAQAVVLRGLALDTVDALWAALQAVGGGAHLAERENKALEELLAAMPSRPAVERAGTSLPIESLEAEVQWLDHQLSLAGATGEPAPEAERLWQDRVEVMNSLVQLRYVEAQRVDRRVGGTPGAHVHGHDDAVGAIVKPIGILVGIREAAELLSVRMGNGQNVRSLRQMISQRGVRFRVTRSRSGDQPPDAGPLDPQKRGRPTRSECRQRGRVL